MKRAQEISKDQLKNWKLLKEFRDVLTRHLELAGKAEAQVDHRRTLFDADYFCLHLFSFYNPVLKTMRGLCRASQLREMRSVCSAPVSPASFSEAQHQFDPEILVPIINELVSQAQPCFGDLKLREAIGTLTAVDGTIIRAVNRMAWAPAAGHGKAIRIHLQFSVFNETPQDWLITPANVCERKIWSKRFQPGQFHVADRLYGNDHKVLANAQQAGLDFVIRLHGNTVLTPVEEDRPVSQADKKAGVVWDRIVRLGAREGGPVFRVVRIEADGKEFLLVTTRRDLTAEQVGVIYRYRWQIEVFFKWIKTLMKEAHWIAESPQGVAIRVYSLFIAALMLSIWIGKRPTKRQLEALYLFWTGFTDEDGLILLLNLEKKA